MSDFWKKKMRTYFVRIDFDKDNLITQKDFQGMGEKFTAAGKFDEAKSKELKEKIMHIWDQFLQPQLGGAEGIAPDAFTAGMQALIAKPDADAILGGPLKLFFEAVDSNNDNQIDAGEYGQFFGILKLDESMAQDAFKAIDTNNDGLLSVEEFQEAGLSFFKDQDDKSPCKVFWGPLVD